MGMGRGLCTECTDPGLLSTGKKRDISKKRRSFSTIHYPINFCTSVQNTYIYNKIKGLPCTDLVPSALFFVQNVQKSALLPVDKSVDNSAAPHKSYPQISLCLWITFFSPVLY